MTSPCLMCRSFPVTVKSNYKKVVVAIRYRRSDPKVYCLFLKLACCSQTYSVSDISCKYQLLITWVVVFYFKTIFCILLSQ